MPGPKSRISRSKRGMRRAHNALSPINTQNCPNCGAVNVPHKVCNSCGYYKGREVIAPKD